MQKIELLRLSAVKKSRDNNAMHAKPDLRVCFEMEDLSSGLGDRGRYHAWQNDVLGESLVASDPQTSWSLKGWRVHRTTLGTRLSKF